MPEFPELVTDSCRVVQNDTTLAVVLVVGTTEVEVEVVGTTAADPQAASVNAATPRLTAAASLPMLDPLFAFDRSSGGFEKPIGENVRRKPAHRTRRGGMKRCLCG